MGNIVEKRAHIHDRASDNSKTNNDSIEYTYIYIYIYNVYYKTFVIIFRANDENAMILYSVWHTTHEINSQTYHTQYDSRTVISLSRLYMHVISTGHIVLSFCVVFFFWATKRKPHSIHAYMKHLLFFLLLFHFGFVLFYFFPSFSVCFCLYGCMCMSASVDIVWNILHSHIHMDEEKKKNRNKK